MDGAISNLWSSPTVVFEYDDGTRDRTPGNQDGLNLLWAKIWFWDVPHDGPRSGDGFGEDLWPFRLGPRRGLLLESLVMSHQSIPQSGTVLIILSDLATFPSQ